MSLIIKENIYEMIRTEPVKNPKIFKAKIIPYTVKGSKLFFLLSKEQRNLKETINSIDSTKFNMLGGSCDPDETIIQTANRELCEETIHVFEDNIDRIKRIPRQNIVRVEKFYNKHHKGTIYIFFLPVKTFMMEPIIKQFKERKQVISKVYDKTPLTRQNYESIEAILNFQFKNKKIVKRNVKCFNEISELGWFSEDNVFNNDGIHQFLKMKLKSFRDAQTGNLYSFEEFSEILKKNI